MATFSPQTMLNVYENCVSNGKNMEDPMVEALMMAH